jgi:hypothetical protein
VGKARDSLKSARARFAKKGRAFAHSDEWEAVIDEEETQARQRKDLEAQREDLKADILDALSKKRQGRPGQKVKPADIDLSPRNKSTGKESSQIKSMS